MTGLLLVLLVLLVALNGLFVAAEIGLVRSRRARLQVMAREGERGAQKRHQEDGAAAVAVREAAPDRGEEKLEKGIARAQQAQLDRDTQFAKVVELTDRLNQGEVKLLALEERGNQLNSQIAAYKMVMTAHGWDPTTPVSDIPPVNLTGLVLVVTDKDLVEISLGKDDGLREGHIMQIYRGDTYIGQIRIMKVAPDRAVGQIDKDLKRGQVRKGDHVTTKFS